MQSVQSGNIIDVFVFSFHIGQLQTVLVGNSYDMGRVLQIDLFSLFESVYDILLRVTLLIFQRLRF